MSLRSTPTNAHITESKIRLGPRTIMRHYWNQGNKIVSWNRCILFLPSWKASRKDSRVLWYLLSKKSFNDSVWGFLLFAVRCECKYKRTNILPKKTETQVTHVKKQPRSTYQDLPHPTIFHEILSSQLPESEKSVSRLKDEAGVVVGAGTLTNAWALCVTTYYLLTCPEILTKLKTEFKSLIPKPDAQPIPLAVLKNCQYLTGVVQEALRLSDEVVGRLQRISPNKELVFHDQKSKKNRIIPRGTPVSMTSMYVHRDLNIFLDPLSFRPKRWIENPRLNRFLVSFSKNSRQCIRINLAYAEIYFCLFGIFSRFGSREPHDEIRMNGDESVLKLFETGLNDVQYEADGFIPLPPKESQGIKIKIRSWSSSEKKEMSK